MTDMITVRLRAFAGLREALGYGEKAVTVAQGTNVAGLLAWLDAGQPEARLGQRRVAVAVNRAYAAPEAVLTDGDEVALIPPVSGGAGHSATARLFEITTQPLSLDEVAARLAAPDRGGVTVFAGTVRGVTPAVPGVHGPIATDYLEYEAYPEMAESVLAGIGNEVQARWPAISAVSIVHRVGKLAIGETAVVVAVAAAHRQDTFAACQYAIDRVKQIAPIWKREVGADGATWVEGPEPNLADPQEG
jgi:molybdopterin converting factor subunit 1